MEANDTHLNIEPSILKEDILEDLLRETADPIPFGPGHWQGNNNMGKNVTPCNPHSIITEGGKEYIKLHPFIEHPYFSKGNTNCAYIARKFLSRRQGQDQSDERYG